jgi:hypothetical protein
MSFCCSHARSDLKLQSNIFMYFKLTNSLLDARQLNFSSRETLLKMAEMANCRQILTLQKCAAT